MQFARKLMCLAQKKSCDERSKLILLLADNRFCVQQLEENASPKKVLFLFVRPHKKFFAFFLCVLHKWFLQLAKTDFCVFHFCKTVLTRSIHSWGTFKCGLHICVTQKSVCGKSNKTCLLFAKKVLCGRTKIFWVLACCSCCTKQIIFAGEANNHLR